MKILLAVPTFENIAPDTFKSIYDLDKCGHEVVFEYIRGYDCARARNDIVDRAKAIDAEYIFMVDSDMILPRDALSNLLDINEDIALGHCLRKVDNAEERKTAIFKLGEMDYEDGFTPDELLANKLIGNHKIQVNGGGMACALIRTAIFDKFDYPYYKYVSYSDGSSLSEDLYFCSQCKQADIPIYVDARVSCGHIFKVACWE